MGISNKEGRGKVDVNHGIGSRGSSDRVFFFACSGFKPKKKRKIGAGILEKSTSFSFSSDRKRD